MLERTSRFVLEVLPYVAIGADCGVRGARVSLFTGSRDDRRRSHQTSPVAVRMFSK